MSWANLDDRLHAHPKVRRLQRIPFAGAEAFGIWCWCLSWCRAYTPDTGRIVVANVALDWNGDEEHFEQVFALLASVGLVDPDGDGGVYLVHDWNDWQLQAQSKAGKARAATATRDEKGHFLPSALDPLEKPGHPAGHASPRLSSPRLSSMDEVRKNLEKNGVIA